MTGWRLLVDEMLDPAIAERLCQEGHDVDHVKTADGVDLGDDDETLLAFLGADDRILLTHDRDFEAFDVDRHEGVVMLYNDERSTTEITWAMLELIDQYGDPEQLTFDVLDNYF